MKNICTFKDFLSESVMTIIDNDRTHRNTIDLSISFESYNKNLANKAAKAINDFVANSQDIKKLQRDNFASMSTLKSPEESYADPGEWYFSWSIIFSIKDDKDIDIANNIVQEISNIAKKLKIKVKIQDNIFSKKSRL